MRFIRRFWEHYLSFIVRGKEITFEFEVVKGAGDGRERSQGASFPPG